jgi:putative endonuclease
MRSSVVGHEGEALAVDYLKKRGYRIIEQNYRCQLGEIDIVAVDRKTLCFIEVKTRSTGGYDRPEVSVHTQKQRRLSRVALWFLKQKHLEDVKARFDVVAIRRRGDLNEVHHFKNAFDVIYPEKTR